MKKLFGALAAVLLFCTGCSQETQTVEKIVVQEVNNGLTFLGEYGDECMIEGDVKESSVYYNFCTDCNYLKVDDQWIVLGKANKSKGNWVGRFESFEDLKQNLINPNLSLVCYINSLQSYFYREQYGDEWELYRDELTPGVAVYVNYCGETYPYYGVPGDNLNIYTANHPDINVTGYEYKWSEPLPEVFPEQTSTFVYDCKPLEYTISYELNGGTFTAEYPAVHIYNKTTELPDRTSVNLEGKLFTGWYTTSDFQEESRISVIEKNTITENVTLYAKWNQSYKITYSPEVEAFYGDQLYHIFSDEDRSLPEIDPLKHCWIHDTEGDGRLDLRYAQELNGFFRKSYKQTVNPKQNESTGEYIYYGGWEVCSDAFGTMYHWSLYVPEANIDESGTYQEEICFKGYYLDGYGIINSIPEDINGDVELQIVFNFYVYTPFSDHICLVVSAYSTTYPRGVEIIGESHYTDAHGNLFPYKYLLSLSNSEFKEFSSEFEKVTGRLISREIVYAYESGHETEFFFLKDGSLDYATSRPNAKSCNVDVAY